MNVSSGSCVAMVAVKLAAVGYDPTPAYSALADVSPLVRLLWAARSCAPPFTPRNVGMAMASKMAMINSTTISSIRVKPDSVPSS